MKKKMMKRTYIHTEIIKGRKQIKKKGIIKSFNNLNDYVYLKQVTLRAVIKSILYLYIRRTDRLGLI
jgi:hypothetical protein